MDYNTQSRLVELRNEIKAQKVASGLTYSNLLLPENTPTVSYSGTASLPASGNNPVARLRFRFSRTDGIVEPPLINFAYSVSYSPTHKEFLISHGFTISGDDVDVFDWLDGNGYIAETGDGYVDFYVELLSTLGTDYFDLNSLSYQVTCQAIANVRGTLVVERLI